MITTIRGLNRIPDILKSTWMDWAMNCSFYPIRLVFPGPKLAVTSKTRPSPQIVFDANTVDDLIGIYNEITYIHLYKSEYRLIYTKLGTKKIGVKKHLFKIII